MLTRGSIYLTGDGPLLAGIIMKTLRLLFRVVSLSVLLASCGGGGGDEAPAGVAVVSSAGIELVAGGIGGAGNRDATGTDSRFYQPFGIAVAADGTRYIADNLNHTIRKVSPAGAVTTLAGKVGEPGTADGTGAAARFNRPGGVALAADGTLYVSDAGNFTIRAISPAGEVTTLAGLAGTSGMLNGTGNAARLGAVAGLVVASDGVIYFCDLDNRLIRKVTPAGEVSSVAGLAGWSGNVDGTGTDARFNLPVGIAVDGSDVLYVTDAGAHTIRRVTTAGVVTTLAGGAGSSGLVDANGTSARFNAPYGVVAEADGTLYVADTLNTVVRKVTPAGDVSTLASLANVPAPGVAVAAPTGIGHDGSGLLYVTDANNHRVLSVTAAGVVTPVLGAAPLTGAANGTGAAARFSLPAGVAVDDLGTVYVADTGNHTVRKVTAGGVVTTLAGTAGLPGSADGLGATARFNQPIGLALDSAGNLYVADAGNFVIRKVTPAGQVTTLAGQAGQFGGVDGTGSAARFSLPVAVAVDTAGNVYVSDQVNHAIRKVTAAGEVTTLAGTLGAAGNADGTGSAARFRSPGGIGVDANGTVYVADYGNDLLRAVTAAGEVTTLAGVSGAAGVVLGALPGGLNQPQGLALGTKGELYVSSENAVLKVTTPTPIPVFDVALTGSATTLIEGQSLTLTWSSRDATNCQATGDWSGALATSGSTTVTVGAAGTYTYTLTCDENGGPGVKSDAVTVTVVPPTPLLTMSGSKAFVAPGDPFTLTWAGTNITSCTASGAWSGARATNGSETLTPAAGNQSYTLTCTGSGGSVSRTVNVSVAPPPLVTLTASATSVKVGTPFTLTWTSSNASTCVAAGGGWSGVRATSGSETFTLTTAGVVSYTLSCSGGGGTKVTGVTITATDSGGGGGGGGSSGGGGGGGALDLWGLLALGGLLLRRRRE